MPAGRLFRAIDVFLPWRAAAPIDATFRGRMVAGISLSSALVGAFFAVFCLFAPAQPLLTSLLCCVGTVAFVANLWLLRRHERLRVAAWAFTLELTAIIAASAWLSHGYRDAITAWQMCLPLVAIFLVGTRNSLLCVAFSALNSWVLWRLEAAGLYRPPLLGVDETPVMVLSAGLAIMLFLVAVGIFYEHTHAARRRELDQTIVSLRSAHDSLSAMQQQLVATEKLASLGMLAAGVAHEINNPMAFVTSNVSGLIRDFADLRTDHELYDEYAREVLPATLDGIKRVNAIVADLRRFARGEPESFVPYDVNQEIGAAVRMAHGELKKRGCRLDVDLGTLPQVVGRPRQVMQVVMNLVVNAAQASTKGDAVRVTSWADTEQVAIRVQDSGAGMTDETRAKLFQPFFTTKPAGQGTGLGLAVVHGIVTSHGGRIDVDSAVGSGSTFTVWLPKVPSARPGESASPL
ncbi:MAG: hypothetical protein IPJ65_28400 [Archangiaceae bacterium]|nr:hypothetical protein [Archangiaceae bacterium]